MPKKSPGRRTNLLGSNIRKGFIPGGMVRPYRPRKHVAAATEVKAAAEETLTRHGVEPLPNAFDCTQHNVVAPP